MYQYVSKAPPSVARALGITSARIGGGVVLSMRNDPTDYWNKGLAHVAHMSRNVLSATNVLPPRDFCGTQRTVSEVVRDRTDRRRHAKSE
jgi:hypothetical protein